MNIRHSGWQLSCLVLLAAALLNTGCVTNGRRVLLKEYSSTVPAAASQSLKGVTVYVGHFNCSSNAYVKPVIHPTEPEPYQYVSFTSEQQHRWTTEMNTLQQDQPNLQVAEIGNMRNALGSNKSRVYSLNDPGAWIADSLKLDLEAQGAKIVDAHEAALADITISGTVQLCYADVYAMIDGYLIVDVDVQPHWGQVRHNSFYTHGSTLAGLASEGSYYRSLREARQKFSILVTRELIQALKPYLKP